MSLHVGVAGEDALAQPIGEIHQVTFAGVTQSPLVVLQASHGW